MADIELVIKIDEKDYQSLKDGHIPFNMLDVIKTGTPLPKDHGRLIDADKLISSFPNYDGMSDVAKTIDYAPTIIEADTESKV